MTNERRKEESPTFESDQAYYQYNNNQNSKFQLLRFDCRDNFSKFDKITSIKVSAHPINFSVLKIFHCTFDTY